MDVSRAQLTRSAAATVAAAMLLGAGLYLRGDANPDWAAYEAIYDDGGAWLADLGRDPLFVALMGWARDALGRHGYEALRLALLAGVVTFAAGLVLVLPGSAPIAAVAVVAMFLTKATIQIREGLAFVFVVVAVVRIVRGRAPLPTYALLIAAALTHIGTAPYVLLCALTHRPPPRRLLLVVAVMAAVLLGRYAAGLFASADEALEQLGLGRSFEEGSPSKWLYWMAYGGVLLMLARELTQDGHRFGLVLAWGLLPFLYALAVCLLATNQPLPAVEVVARLLATGTAISLLVLLLRKRASLLVLAASMFLIVAQLRAL